MATIWGQVSKAFRGLNPATLAQEADRPLSLALIAEGPDKLGQMEEFFVPRHLGPRKREQVREKLFPFLAPLRPPQQQMLPEFDLVAASEGVAGELEAFCPRVYFFHPQEPQLLLREILQERRDLALPLARNFLPFRSPVQRRWIHSIAFENALFATTTAVPDVLPAPFALPWAAAEFASSTVFLTANQMRLAFLLAASSDSQVGFREQKGQLTAIAGAALGWRSLARELAGKIPAGRGLLAKGLMAFVGTYSTGLALEQFHALGRSLTREEKSAAYEQAYRIGRGALDKILDVMASRASVS